MRKQKISITTPTEYIAQVDEIAERRKRSRSYIITEAIEKFLETTNQTKPTKKTGTR